MKEKENCTHSRSGLKDDPATRVEIRIDQDVFDERLALAGKPRNGRGNCFH